MSTSDVSKFYLFLASHSDWAAVADSEANGGNGNGCVQKFEFRDYMKNSYDGWNGESSSSQEDLINSFWKLIDTSTKGAITGSGGVSNYNALDSGEIKALNNKLELYKILDEFISESVKVPTCLTSYASKWKNSVSASLSAYTEQWIKDGTATSENLKELLTGVLTEVECKTTADYCAIQFSENLKNQYSTLLGDYTAYDGSSDSDETLKAIIDEYISQMDMTTFNPEQIMADIQNIINAYFATAGIGEGDTSILEQYGYSQGSSDLLNPLQKATIKAEILKEAQNNNEEFYQEDSEYREDFLNALNEYINTLTLSDFDIDNADGLQFLRNFRNSSQYKAVQTKAEVNNVLNSDEFYQKLTNDIGDSIANKIKNDSRYVDEWEEIVSEAIEKAQAGDFGDPMDAAKLQAWVVEQIKANLSSFYKNGYGDMSASELEIVYNVSVEAADNEKDDDTSLQMHRDAAIDICDALVSKGGVYEQIVYDEFGDSNYKDVINSLYPSEITTKINNILANAKLIETLSATWSGSSEQSVTVDASVDLNIQATVKDNNNNQYSGITYTAEVTSGSDFGSVSVNDGTITVTGSATGTMKIKVTAMYNGTEVSSTTVTVNVVNAKESIDWTNLGLNNDKYNGNNFELYTRSLSGSDSQFKTDLPNNLPRDIDAVTTWIEDLYNQLTSKASELQLSTTALSIAKEQMIGLYTAALEAIYSQCSNESRLKRGKGSTVGIEYNGKTYYASYAQDDDGKEFNTNFQANNQSAANSDLGIYLWVKTDRKQYGLNINTSVMKDMFEQLYKQALGA